ncbi:MAG TPA: TonB family protein [Lacunisphaera sp.]
MSTTFTGALFDGETLAVRTVILEASDGRLRSQTEDVALEVALSGVRTSDRLATLPRFLYLPDGRTIETADNDAIDALLAGQQRGRVVAAVHWLEVRSRIAAVATVLLVASVAASAWWALPVLAHQAAMAVPPSIERQAGQTAMATLNRLLAPSQLKRTDQARVNTQLERLLKARPLPARPELVFRSMGGKFPNAFALPGGFIVVSDELVTLANNEELAAVLAHEIGHWQLRHGLQGVLRSSAALLLVSTVSGDLSALTTFAGTIPFVLLQRGYSREFEEAADAYAVDLLRQANISVAHFATILKKLEDARPGSGQDLTYLSTHPATSDRIKRINPDGYLPPPISEPGQWSAVTNDSTRYDAKDLPADPSRRSVQDLTQKITDPKPLEQLPPPYPRQKSRRSGEGTAVIEFIVDEQGAVQQPIVTKSSHPDFEAPALEAARHWKFSPGRYGDRNVRAHITSTIRFGSGETSSAESPDMYLGPQSNSASTSDNAAGAPPVRLGSGDIRPKALWQPRPQYPKIMSDHSLEGEVVVEFIIDTKGSVREPRIVRSTHKEFEAPAIEAVMQWRFTPGQRNGREVATRVSQIVVFNLEDPPAAKEAANENSLWLSRPSESRPPTTGKP